MPSQWSLRRALYAIASKAQDTFQLVREMRFDLISFILLEERREPYTRLGVKQCMLRLTACVCVCACVRACVSKYRGW